MKRAIAPLALVVVLVALVVLATSSGSSHRINAMFQSATNLVAGARVTAGGVQVGSVGSITLHDGLADVALDITDNRVWPLPQGTQAEIRWGGTLSYSDRYVELLPGPKRASPLPDGAVLPTADTVTPVEFDQLFNVFTPAARRSLGSLVDRGATTFDGRSAALGRDLSAAGPALTQISGVLTQLGDDPRALQTLVSSGAQTAAALHAHQAQLADLVSAAGTTFSTVAGNARDTELTLARLPGALQAARSTLGSLDPTLQSLDGLVTEIAPGSDQLRALAAPLGAAVRSLSVVAPKLNRTLAVVQRHGAAVTRLLATARPVLTALRPALDRLAPIVGCIRPYAPEIAGWVTTWQSMGSFFDSGGHYGRVLVQAFPFPDDSPLTPSTVTKLFPGVGYSLIRPPGYDAAQTWYQPQCGAGTQGLDPADDPEAGG